MAIDDVQYKQEKVKRKDHEGDTVSLISFEYMFTKLVAAQRTCGVLKAVEAYVVARQSCLLHAS